MATDYPGAIDSFTNPTGTDGLSSPSHADQHANANDAIEAIETALGVKYGARVHAKRAAARSVNTGGDLAIELNETDVFDTDAFHDPSVNSSRITVPTGMGGVYLMVGGLRWAVNSTGNRIVKLRLNGSTDLAGDTRAAVATNSMQQSVTDIRALSESDYVELVGFQSSGGSLNATDSFLILVKIG